MIPRIICNTTNSMNLHKSIANFINSIIRILLVSFRNLDK